MSLFGLGKKKEEKIVPAVNTEIAVKSVKVLGGGCKSCHELLMNTNQALKNLSVPMEAEYITDMATIAAYGIMSTPALVVNDKIMSMGKVCSVSEIETLLHKC
jgi:small redox-active disulfide protein 2